MRYLTIPVCIWLSAVVALLSYRSACASVIWTGNPASGTSVFKLLNLEDANKVEQANPSANGSSITVITDPTYGQDFQFYKAAADLRAEAHGAKNFDPAIGSTYYLGWRFEVNSTVNDNAVFQWKAYGTTGSTLQQNFPLVLSFRSNELQLHYFSTGEVDHLLWSEPEVANTWNSIVLCIHVEPDNTGYVNYWWDGAAQSLAGSGTTYNCSTFDPGGTSIDPKWGIYGAVGTQVTNDVNSLAIGTTYADVAPGPVPEPHSLALLGTCAVAIPILLAHRRRAAKFRHRLERLG
jgi:hypothetical protein